MITVRHGKHVDIRVLDVGNSLCVEIGKGDYKTEFEIAREMLAEAPMGVYHICRSVFHGLAVHILKIHPDHITAELQRALDAHGVEYVSKDWSDEITEIDSRLEAVDNA